MSSARARQLEVIDKLGADGELEVELDKRL
jgi:hypothetical protein